ncbi:ADP-ribosylation factor GTPase-activating protein 2-like isoform X2 [Uloborus diversus]|uniref:ADP-ribosylation factor GTPase-activating protein 2-like isoform X2 n=1 Tax=Uloborus diversus TaxID=327109 RepID=UPI00240A0B3D|nr:ADP-ribosylation factor GTPase-activating protein 2-like isoform X2 [Uloborus diversus]
MAEEKLCKNDIAAVFKRLRSIQSNKVCFDCRAKNPTWASVTYGVFICMDCSAVHRSLGVHLSFVRSTQLDTNWTWLQLRAMQVGGNHNAMSFFQQHGCASQDAQQKYNSRAAQLYRDKLHQLAAGAMRLHGTKLHIEIPHAEVPASPEKREIDFFKDIADADLFENEVENSEKELSNGSCLRNSNSYANSTNLDANLEISLEASESIRQSEPRKSTITGRKPVAAKKGLGGKKGLGALKVTANFDDIEKEAEKLDRLREQAEIEASAPVPAEEQEKQIASVRLAYKDLSLQQKKTEEKMRQTNPQKAEQLERLGMGFTGRNAGSVAHSAASEMKLIAQETPGNAPSRNLELVDDDFEFLSLTSGPPKYGDSPFLSRSSSERLNEVTGKGYWMNEKVEKRSPLDTLLPSSKDTSGRARKSASTSNLGTTDEAQKKFGNAKGISSDQFFGSSKDSEYERKANLTRFEGSSSISSEDYFGGDSRRNTSASSYATPNLYDIKEGVRDGVTKVAGRLSSIANGVMSSLQRK